MVHVALDRETALAELPAIASGDVSVAPSSGLGSNANVDAGERKVPKALIFGGGLPEGDIKAVTEALCNAAPNVKPIVVTKGDILAAGGTGPDPDLISRLIKEKLIEAGL